MTFLRGNPPCMRQIREGAARGVNRTRNSAPLVANGACRVKALALGPPVDAGSERQEHTVRREAQKAVPMTSRRNAAPRTALNPKKSSRRPGDIEGNYILYLTLH